MLLARDPAAIAPVRLEVVDRQMYVVHSLVGRLGLHVGWELQGKVVVVALAILNSIMTRQSTLP